MACIGGCFASCLAGCCCTAVGSLSSSCCGNNHDPSSSKPVGASSGRKRSVLLLVAAVGLQLAFQFALAPWFVDHRDSWKTTVMRDSWLDGCSSSSSTIVNNTINNEEETILWNEEALMLLDSCVGRGGNYRIAFVTVLFFLLAALAAVCKPTANREAWPAKIVLYLLAVAGSIFLPNEPILTPIFLTIAIVGGALFIAFQQIVILDLAHNWNDGWVEKSNAAEAQETGSGKIWLYAILACCAVLFGGALAVLIFLMIEFTGCSTNNTFIGLTLVFCLLLTVAQMTSDEGSLLSSACISAWAVFLCYNAVSKNPNTDCNPRLGELSPLRIALGLLMTLLSLAWTGWSYTAADKFTNNKSTDANKPSAQNAPDGEIDQPLPDSNSEGPKKRAVTGVVVTETATHDTDGTANGDTSGDGANNDESTDSAANKPTYNNAWKLNMVLAAVTCWSAMTLTEWGQIQSNGTIANPTVGHVGMWVIVGSQWFVMTLYLWTLVAPRLFPDRDFS